MPSWLRRNTTQVIESNSKEIFKELFNTYQESKAMKRKTTIKAPPPPTRAEVFLTKVKAIIASNFWKRSFPVLLSLIILFWIFKKRRQTTRQIQKTKFDVKNPEISL